MKKRNLFLIAITIIIASLFVSCSADGGGDGLAYAVLSITNDRARTISSGNDSVEITKYYVKLTHSKLSQSYEMTFDKNESGTYEIKGVVPGDYTVLVEARTKDDTKVSEGSTTHRFTRGEDRTTFSVTLNTLYGNQDTTITYTWDTNMYSSATLVLAITDEKGNAVTTTGCITTPSNGKTVFTKNLPAGSYLFVASLKEDGYTVLGYTEVVRVTNGNGTAITHTINLTSYGVSSETNTASINSSSLYVPLTGTLNFKKDSSFGSAELTITNLPAGITENDVMVTWYVEDYIIAEDSKKGGMTAKFDPMGPVTIVTAVMQCAKTGSMGSVTGLYLEE